MNKIFKLTITLCAILMLSNNTHSETIKIGVLTSAVVQKQVYVKYAKEFEALHPNINIEYIFKPDAEYKETFATWLQEGKGPSIVSWQAGNRLSQVIDKNNAFDLTEFYKKHNLSEVFTQSAINAVSVDDRKYAIPTSYYQWGFFYRQSVFERLGLQPPQTWEQFLHVCQTLKKNSLTPITIGTKFDWPVAAWFDYLNLRINGLPFHKSLLSGNKRFDSPEVRRVFSEWKTLIDAGYFIDSSSQWSWIEAMPFVYHQQAGMTLVGNFFAGSIPTALADDFKFFRFPVIDPTIPVFEEAPMDLFMMPAYANMTPNIEKILLMFASQSFQQEFNIVSAMISPRADSTETSNYFINQGRQTLEAAAGLSQFFDRDTSDQMARAAMPILNQFLQDADIDRAIEMLEKARKKYLSE